MGWGPLGHWFAGSSLPSKSPNPSLVVEQKSSTNHPERTRLEASKSPTRPVASNKNTTGAAKQPNANVLGAQITAEQPQTDIEPASIAVPLPVNNAVAGLDPTVSSGLNPTIPLGAASGTETAPDSNITIKPSVAESPTLETPQKLNPTIPLGIAATDGADDSIQSVATTPTLELRVPSSPGAAFPLRSLEIDPPNSAVLVP